jgi:metal-responsive CopG/Arc/MetJ family transcriptional regulator
MTKKITTFSLDESIVKDFDSFCVKEEKSRSKVANNIFKSFVESKKKK